LSSYF